MQFYLLLFVCFLVMTPLVDLVYKFTVERAGRQSLDDLMKSSLYLIRNELCEIPPRDWGRTLKEMDLNLSFGLRVEPLNRCILDTPTMQRLRGGDTVALGDQCTFIQRIPRSHYVLTAGPVPYLCFLHQMRLLDIALMALIAISLAFPVLIWMRPHWRGVLRLESTTQHFGKGHLGKRLYSNSDSNFECLDVTFNQMAGSISTLIASKEQLIDDIAHKLRIPLVRLRYRLEMSDNLTEQGSQALNRDIGQLKALVKELLAHVRLDRPQNELKPSVLNLSAWLTTHLEGAQSINPDRAVQLCHLETGDYDALDMRLMKRILDNLLNNILRYCQSMVQASLLLNGNQTTLVVEGDGPGTAPDVREQVFEPLVRLDPGHDRVTGDCGLGSTIAYSMALTMEGTVVCDESELGDARFTSR